MNTVELKGKVISVDFGYECLNEVFYIVTLLIKRLGENYDEIPVMVSEKLVDTILDIKIGSYLGVKGQYRSHFNNERVESKGRLVLYVFANELEFLDTECYEDKLEIIGDIKKQPIIRETPLGRTISDVLILVDRESYGKSDYIPCIFWGRNASYVSRLGIGDELHITGRIQSRKYQKNGQDKTAYEVSVGFVNLVS